MTAKEWRPLAVEKYGEESRAVQWLDKLAREGNGEPLGGLDSTVWGVLGMLDAGELEVD
jgi:hypothetical protein